MLDGYIAGLLEIFGPRNVYAQVQRKQETRNRAMALTKRCAALKKRDFLGSQGAER